MRVVASIEARMGSSRLPGKVLRDIRGVPALTRQLRRLRRCRELDDIILATTILPADDALEDWAKNEGVRCFRGSSEDVLGRVCGAQAEAGSDVIVEVTGDAVLADPDIIDMGVRIYKANAFDVVSNTWKPGYPQGMDVQVFSRNLLQSVADSVTDPAAREHVSLYFYENPDRYRICHLLPPPRWSRSSQRTQLDYEEDYRFLEEVYAHLEPRYGDEFGIEEVLRLLDEKPSIAKINAECEEKAAR